MSAIDKLLKKSKENFFMKSFKPSEKYYYVDLFIIGAGISGIELAYQMGTKWKSSSSKNDNDKSIAVFEQSDYIGGRVRTVYDKYKGKTFSYEAGAARFNNNHQSLIGVIKRCGLYKNVMKIPSFWDFRPSDDYKKKVDKIPYENVEDLLNELLKYYNKPGFKNYLKNKTLYEACLDLYGPKVAEFLKNSYSYYSEIKVFNGNNAIKTLSNDLGESNQFYILGGGLSTVIHKTAEDFINSCRSKTTNKKCDRNRFICTRCAVKSWKYNKDTKKFIVNVFNLETDEYFKVTTTNLVIAVDGKAIRRWRNSLAELNHEVPNIISHVTAEPLMRTFAIYDSKWFKKENIGKFVTDATIKYFIPVNQDIGLVMVSYTDGEYVRRMMRYVKDGTQQEIIYNDLKELFPDIKIEKKVKYLKNEYWDVGAVYWNKGADSKKMSKIMLKPSANHNLFICGDSFSENQAWTDGAISTAHKVSKLI